jgi:hypothetical protein
MTTRDEVLAMAREAGATDYTMSFGTSFIMTPHELERFHALAVAKEREELVKQGWKSPGLRKHEAVEELLKVKHEQNN